MLQSPLHGNKNPPLKRKLVGTRPLHMTDDHLFSAHCGLSKIAVIFVDDIFQSILAIENSKLRLNFPWNVLHLHDDVIKWKHFPRNWPFVRKIHRSPVNFPHKGQWRGALMFSLIYAWINNWVNNREAGDLRRQHGHYDVIVMWVQVSIG